MLPGEGRPLFAGRRERQALQLSGSKTFETGLVQLHYQVLPSSAGA